MNKKALFHQMLLLCCLAVVWNARTTTAQTFKLQTLPNQRLLPVGNVHCILEDADGFLWYGTQGGGVCRANGYQIDVFRSDRSHPDVQMGGDVLCLSENRAARQIWVGTKSGAFIINRTDCSTEAVDASPFTLTARHIPDILCARDSTVWLVLRDSLLHFSPEGRLLGGIRSMWHGRSANPTSMTELADGRILVSISPCASGGMCVAGGGGLVVCLHSDYLARTATGIHARVTAWQADSCRRLTCDSVVRIAVQPSVGTVELELSTLDILHSSQIQFAWRLQGKNAEWHTLPIGANTVRLPHLGKGHYAVEVRATDRWGRWNDAVVVAHIDREPAWWETWWAYILYIIVIAGGASLALWWRHRQQALLEEQERAFRAQTDELERLRQQMVELASRQMQATPESPLQAEHEDAGTGSSVPIAHIILFMLLAACLTPCCAQQFTTLDGLGSNDVRTIMQDADGYLWVGTAHGLSRFDGLHFINFTTDDNSNPYFFCSDVCSIREDTLNHLLWLSSSVGIISCYDQRQGRFIDYCQGLEPIAPVMECFASSRQLVFYGDGYGLRQIKMQDRQPHTRDFTQANGKLHHNRIRPLCADTDGNVWLPSQSGLARLSPSGNLHYVDDTLICRAATFHDGHLYVIDDHNTIYTYSPDGQRLSSTHIPNEVIATTENVWSHFWWHGQWVVMGRDRAFIFNPRIQRVQRPQDWEVLNGKVLYQTDGNVWVISHNSDLVIFMADGSVRRLSLIPRRILDMGIQARYSIARVDSTHYYVATNGNGLFYYDILTGELTHHLASHPQPLIHSNYLLSACVDSDGSLWLATDMAGLMCIARTTFDAEYIYPDISRSLDRTNIIRAIAPESDGTLTVSTRSGHTYSYQPQTHTLTQTGFVSGMAYAIFTDSRGRRWTGTRGNGLCIDGTYYTPRTPMLFASPMVADFAEDNQGRVWMATLNNGLLCAQTMGDSLHFSYHMTDNILCRHQHAVCIDNRNRLWVGTEHGLYVARLDGDTPEFRLYSKKEGTFCMNVIQCLAMDADGSVFVGGSDGVARCGLSDDGHLAYIHVGREQGLRSTNVASILPDGNGGVWIGTDAGVARWDSLARVAVHHHFATSQQGNVCSVGSAMRADNGDLVFGTNHGLLVLSSNSLAANTSPAPPRITAIGIGAVGDIHKISPCNVDTKSLSLPYDQNTLTVTFSTNDLSGSTNTIFHYWLEGLEKPESHVSTDGMATYNDLPPGHYTLHVITLGGEAALAIHIRQPWWNTWLAWLIYTIIAGSVFYVIAVQLYRNWQLRQRMRREQEQTRFKLDFFTQVSHEFRTPLALITGGIDALASADKATNREDSMKVVRRGAHRLKRLVDQLLQFRRLNENSVRLSMKDTDIVELVRSVYADFYPGARQRELNISFTPYARHETIRCDADAVETIIYNLVSNAVKYTPTGGRIYIKVLAPEDGHLRVSVANSGDPLTAEQRECLFQPYMHGFVSNGGMGIGLYVAHSLARLHGGNLEYGEDEGGGVVFTLTLPVINKPSTDCDTDIRPQPVPSSPPQPDGTLDTSKIDQGEILPLSPALLPPAANDVQVLLCEDDADMAEQLRRDLGPFFHITLCTDGRQALQRMSEGTRPDIIVCDAMMPEMNGFDLCRYLRKDEANRVSIEGVTRHLPIIMLTSLNDDAQHLRGMQAGADLFLTKPCNAQLLINHISKLARRSLTPTPTPSTSGNESIDSGEAIITNLADRRFCDDIKRLVAQNLANANFNVDVLAEAMHLGRTTFFNRFKQLMGMSPNEYIKRERMSEAARLLQQGEFNVGEVATRTGFTDTSHFIRAFKAFHGITPAQFRKS